MYEIFTGYYRSSKWVGDKEKEDLIDNIYAFNKKLMDVIWHNTKKPHRAINKLTPLGYYSNMFSNNNISNMLWTLTNYWT